MYKGLRINVVIPALDEELAIGKVIHALWQLRAEDKPIIDHIIVCDNGSSDQTASVALNAGAQVVSQAIPGYGLACLTGIDALPDCDVVLFVDGDDSCEIPQALRLLDGIYSGDDLAIGSRTLGNTESGALTLPQQCGNWFAARLIQWCWNYKLTDLGPFRAIRRKALRELDMQDKTFGWTVEMQVKAIISGLRMSEYPADSKVRIGQSKISGTIKGSIRAGIGIISMIARLKFQEANKKNVTIRT